VGLHFFNFQLGLGHIRGHEDALNSIASGFITYFVLSFRNGLRGGVRNGTFGAVFLGVIKGLLTFMNQHAEKRRIERENCGYRCL